MKFLVLNSSTEASLPIIFINWAFGFGVIHYPIGRPRPILSAFWSIANFLVYLNFVRMASFLEITELQGSRITANSYRISAYLCIVFLATPMCLAYFRTKIVQGTFTKLTDMNIRLKTLGIPNDYGSAFKYQIVHLSLAFAWIFLTVALDFKYTGFEFPSEMSRLGFFMTFHYFMVFAVVIDYGFNVKVRYFGNRFHRLNALLKKLNSPEKNQTTFTQSDNEFRTHSSVILEIHGNNSPSIKAANNQWLLHVIRETRKIHRGLCTTATELNRAFGIQLFFSVALSFFLITTLFYTSYILGIQNNLTPRKWQEKIIVLAWITFHAIKVLLVVDACVTTSSEANRTGELITKFLNTRACDEDICDEIDVFSLQLLQNPLTFTAGGFFTLNYSLVRGIVRSATTYLVIMIQMRTIYDSVNMNFIPNSTTLVHINDTAQECNPGFEPLQNR